ncbi:hypothetical protein V6K52_01500 [Knoellia sp. S7-12]|uniref:hypothetical protein n=1 Tax=Knoellia sp. S7-12 TaxID=3126698 RepID=UPI0033682BEF
MESASREPPLVVSVLPGLALVLLAASGLVLASSWLTDYPASVLVVAWGVGIVALITAAASGWREGQRTGIGYIRSLGASLKRLGRFALDFF